MGDEAGLGDFNDTGNMCYMGEVKTPFATGEDIDSMKAMLADANPGQVLDVADAWQNVHDHLVSGSGSVKGDFDKAVDHILQHWEGESADEFAKRAKQIGKSIADCATYATRASTVMRNCGHRLAEIKPKVDAIEKPSGFGSAMDKIGDGFSRDNSKWKGEIQGNQGAQKALDNHDGDLSAGKEEQLKAAAHMESLALTYTSQAQTMGSWNKKPPWKGRGDNEDYPGDPGGVAPVPIGVTPDDGGTGAAMAGASRTGSAVGKTTPKSTSPAVAGASASATKVDGVSGGTATAPRPGGASSGAPSGGVPGGGAAAGAGAGGMGGVPGGPGYVGQAGTGRGAAGVGAGAGRGAGGRVPGGLGAGGAGGAAGKGAAGAAGRGPLARSRGGVLDTPQQGKGAAKQGGQGLHSSRGGTQAGARGAAGGRGMVGGAAGNNSRRQQGEREQGDRPDYLVEDEETWMPQRRDVAPPSIG